MSASTDVPGGTATSPREVPPRGWLQIVRRGWAEAQADQVPLLSAGVAFYAFLAIFPALAALVFLYGLISDPASIATQLDSVTAALPADARRLLTDQLTTLAANDTGAGIGVIVSAVIALWSASGGMNNLMIAISTAYDEEKKRSFLKQRGLALLLTLGAIVLMVILLLLVAVLPAVVRGVDDTAFRWGLQAVRWLVLAVVLTVALALLYRVAPDRDAPKFRWTSPGAGIATLLWLLASVGFSIYASFGGYAKTYGALAGIVVLLFWLWISAYAILLGAEINAESEQQTVADTTKGPSRPLGRRGAVKADSVPDGEEVSGGEAVSSAEGAGAKGSGAKAASGETGRPHDDRPAPVGADPRQRVEQARGRLVTSVEELTTHLNVIGRLRRMGRHARIQIAADAARVRATLRRRPVHDEQAD